MISQRLKGGRGRERQREAERDDSERLRAFVTDKTPSLIYPHPQRTLVIIESLLQEMYQNQKKNRLKAQK